jgi:hypothetical protein
MDRKTFIKKAVGACVTGCLCGNALAKTLSDQFEKTGTQTAAGSPDWVSGLESRMVKSTATAPSRVAEKGQLWLKNLLDNMDSMLDEKTKIELMNACGRSCYNGAFGVASEKKVPPEYAEGFLNTLKNQGAEIQDTPNSTIVYYGWQGNHQNPMTGLVLKDGYCMCEFVESIPKGLSPTYCNCSAGYVGEMFKRYLGKPVKVTVISSLISGGSECRFKIEIPKT